MRTRTLAFVLLAGVTCGACTFEPDLGADCPCNPDGTCDHPGCTCVGGRVCVPQENNAICCLPRCGSDSDCDDDNPCTLTSCVKGFCRIQLEPDGTVCGRECSGLELTEWTCVSGDCTGRKQTDCDDGDMCTVDTCDPASGCRNPQQTGLPPEGSEDPVECSDTIDNDCDGVTDEDDPDCRDCNQDAECDDTNPCTLDLCLSDRCQYSPEPDGTPCGDKTCEELGWYQATCQAAACSGSSLLEDCDDGDPCTEDGCDPVTGCRHTPFAKDEDADGYVDAACTDGDDCDDSDPSVHPDAAESAVTGTCNDLVDNDCDDAVDLQDPGCAAGMPQIAWFVPFGGPGYDAGQAVACEDTNTFYLTGFFSGSIVVPGYDGPPIESNGHEDVLVASFYLHGGLRWVKPFGGPGSDVGHDLAQKGDTVYVVGVFEQTIMFDTGQLTAYDATGPDGFVVEYNAMGNYAGSFRLGRDSFDAAYGVTTNEDWILVAGGFEGTIATGTDPANTRGELDGYLTGDRLWSDDDWFVQVGSAGDDEFTACATGPMGDVVVAGYFQDALFVDGVAVLDPTAGSDALVGIVDPNGISVFWDSVSGPGEDVAYGVDVAEDGAIFVTGSFEGEADYQGFLLEGEGGSSAFLLALEPDGALRWPKVLRGPGNVRGLDVAAVVDADGNQTVVVTGFFTEQTDAGGGPLIAAGGTDVFVAAFDGLSGEHLWSLRLGAEGEDAGMGVAVDKMGGILVTGNFEHTIQIGDDQQTSAGLWDGFVMHLLPP